jgi:hypothetical protein
MEEVLMPIFKGTLLGLWLVGFGTLGRFYYVLVRPFPRGTSVAISISTFPFLTIRSVVWWVAVAVCFAVSLALMRVWKGPTAFWVGLGVTGLIPAGFWVLVGVVYYMSRTMS